MAKRGLERRDIVRHHDDARNWLAWLDTTATRRGWRVQGGVLIDTLPR